jgi:ABC-2 type transport system permease protein
MAHIVEAPKPPTTQPENKGVAIGMGRKAQQNMLRNIGLIVAYEFKRRLKQRSFIISTIIILILIVLSMCVPTVIQYITATSNSQSKITIVNNAGPVANMTSEQLLTYMDKALNGTTNQASGTNVPGQNTSNTPHFALSLSASSNLTVLENQVKNGSLNILLVLDRSSNEQLRFTYYSSASALGDANVSQIQALANQISLLDKASHFGLTATQTEQLFSSATFTMVNVGQGQTTRSPEETVIDYILGYAGVILVFMSVYLYGYWVASGVAEEKGSRIMEILVNAATPFQLMAGKILGIGAAGMAQMATLVAVGIGSLLLQAPLKELILGNTTGGLNLNMTSSSIGLLLLMLLYFLLGFLLYAAIFAAVGALVKRQEEIQNAAQLPMWLFIIGYMVSIFGIYSPDALWVKIVSYVPFWTPTAMLMRVAVGAVAWWEIALTVVLMSLFILICTTISARIYRFGVLMYGQKLSMRTLIKLVRS